MPRGAVASARVQQPDTTLSKVTAKHLATEAHRVNHQAEDDASFRIVNKKIVDICRNQDYQERPSL
ncbi:hypothetical protein MPS_1959 [Mycobacterium pseudoshottsii JCM 15466]|nr:hypothetical protein MPS_1959 [Mycobacterium pseudoshottsii JCM 15466]